MSLRKCLDQAEKLIKVLERLDEAEVAYGTNQRYLAASKIGGAWTSLALAYARGVIDFDEYKSIARELRKIREDTLANASYEQFLKDLDAARERILRKFEGKVLQCYTQGGKLE